MANSNSKKFIPSFSCNIYIIVGLFLYSNAIKPNTERTLSAYAIRREKYLFVKLFYISGLTHLTTS
jgi:hypothetical protein